MSDVPAANSSRMPPIMRARILQPRDYRGPFHVGDVLRLKVSKYAHVVVEIEDPYAISMCVKVLGINRTRHKRITVWDIKSVDKFLSAAYKAAHGLVTADENKLDEPIAQKPGL